MRLPSLRPGRGRGAAGAKSDPSRFRDPPRRDRALDQLVAEQGEDAVADEDRPGIAVPVDAGAPGSRRRSPRPGSPAAAARRPRPAGLAAVEEQHRRRIALASEPRSLTKRATGRPSTPEAPSREVRVGAEEEGVAAGLALARIGQHEGLADPRRRRPRELDRGEAERARGPCRPGSRRARSRRSGRCRARSGSSRDARGRRARRRVTTPASPVLPPRIEEMVADEAVVEIPAVAVRLRQRLIAVERHLARRRRRTSRVGTVSKATSPWVASGAPHRVAAAIGAHQDLQRARGRRRGRRRIDRPARRAPAPPRAGRRRTEAGRGRNWRRSRCVLPDVARSRDRRHCWETKKVRE